jgi:hypothetical protein
MGGVVSFTPAKFNTVAGGGSKERAIVTSSGRFVITWNFNRIRQNVLDRYQVLLRLHYFRPLPERFLTIASLPPQINELGGEVVADQFRFGDADTVVVAMPDDVAIAQKKLPAVFRLSMAPLPK